MTFEDESQLKLYLESLIIIIMFPFMCHFSRLELSPLQSKEPKHSQNKLAHAPVHTNTTHTHAHTHTHTHAARAHTHTHTRARIRNA